jgi:sorting nexin-29
VQGSATFLAAAFTTEELYAVIFPPNESVPLPACLLGCPHCIAEAAHRQQWQGHQQDVPPPPNKPGINSRKAAGSDGLRAETFRFPRHPVDRERRQHRLDLCNTLAALFNIFWQHRRVPQTSGFSMSVLTPLHKKGDTSDPDNYRGIAVGNTIPKLFSLVLLRRLSHWAASNNIISAQQAGFQQYQGAEQQALTLIELIRTQWRMDRDMYTLFVDFRKAYDSVHLGALWVVLETMGVPPQMLDVLRALNSARTVQLLFNGTPTASFPQTKGLPQGDVLSPLLFNLYVESLSRYLTSLRGNVDHEGPVPGVPFHERVAPPYMRGLWFNHLFYADDLTAFGLTRTEIEAALQAICRWGRTWALAINTGAGKTEAMRFRRPVAVVTAAVPAPPPPNLDPLRMDPAAGLASPAVGWAAEYKYLGFTLRSDLGIYGMLDQMETTMTRIVYRVFSGNPLVHGMSPTLQLQLLGTLLRGAVQYFLPVLDISEAAAARLDVPFRKAARSIMCHISNRATTAYIVQQCRLPSVWALTQQHRMRIRFALFEHPSVAAFPTQHWRHPPAFRVVHMQLIQAAELQVAAQAAVPLPPPYLWECTPWLDRSSQAEHAAAHAPTPEPLRVRPPGAPFQRTSSPTITALYGARVDYARYITAMRDAEARDVGLQVPSARDPLLLRTYAGLRPRHRPAEHERDIAFFTELRLDHCLPRHVGGLQGLPLWAADMAPLSCQGPAGLGSLFTLCDHKSARELLPLLRFRMGWDAVAMYPFGHRLDEADDPPNFVEAVQHPCRLCGVATDGWHVLNECRHAALAEVRAALHTELPVLMRSIISALRDAYALDAERRVPLRIQAVRPLWSQAAGHVRALLHGYEQLDHDSAGCRFLLHRLVAALPYPAGVVPHPGGGSISEPTPALQTTRRGPQGVLHAPPFDIATDMPRVVRAFGRLLDLTLGPRRLVRPAANLWVTWSLQAIHRLADAYRAALRALPITAPRTTPRPRQPPAADPAANPANPAGTSPSPLPRRRRDTR